MSAARARVIEHAEGFSCELPGGARALFTSRAHGNLSTQRGDGHERGRSARDRLCEELALRWLCASRQVHGTTVQRVRAPAGAGERPWRSTPTATRPPCRRSARWCSPPTACPWRSRARAPWRWCTPAGAGSPRACSRRACARCASVGGAGPLVAVIGPGAGACCYEVGPEVHAAFGGAHRAGQNIDLRAIARDRLLAAGVAQVLDARACTICDERFFSHRREGERAGRQAGVAWLS